MSFMEDFQHLKVQLEDVKLATNNFGADKLIGSGGFGQVYKGELACSEGRRLVAFKRLDRKHGQGDIEFWKEIMMLSKYKHENLVSLVHFCNDGAERILVYEYASRGSLDRYLSDTSLTWTQRLQICLEVACGLNYLHDPMGTQQRVLHRDVKSSNILLDEKWTAKVSDFGLSKIGPANQPNTYLVTQGVGTPGYCDPLYGKRGFLSKESDVYSFGVVLFEVICGRLCYDNFNGILVSMWEKCYEEKRLDEIISPDLKKQMDYYSLNTYLAIAYRCLNSDYKERPTMAEIVIELKIALEHQEFFRDPEQKKLLEEMTKIVDLAVPNLSYKSPKELLSLLSEGILVDEGTSWFSINNNGKNCEMISAVTFNYFEGGDLYEPRGGSRFKKLGNPSYNNFKVEVSPKFLSPHVRYTINLVYNYYKYNPRGLRVPVYYKLDEEIEYLTSCVAYLRKDKWMESELYQFTSSQKKHDFKIEISFIGYSFLLEGIEFRPVEYDKDENLKDVNMVDMQLETYSDMDWEQKLPSDYMEITKWSNDNLQWTTKKELYRILRKGFLINSGLKWFSISKNMKKRYMLPATAFLREENGILKSLLRKKSWTWELHEESRFRRVAQFLDTNIFFIDCKIESQLLSPETIYACYLVYKLPKTLSMLSSLVKFEIESYPKDNRDFFLLTPLHTPIIRSKLNTRSDSLSRTRKIKGHPKLRKDGWMEIQVWHFQTPATIKFVSMQGFLKAFHWNFFGLLVQGIEFRPMKVSLTY